MYGQQQQQLQPNLSQNSAASQSASAVNAGDAESSRWIRQEGYSASLTAACFNPDQELYMRQRCALQAQYLGNRMRLKQICINTAIVCMHRMFIIHNIEKFNNLAFIGASLFIASKVEEVPISLEYCAQTILAFNANGTPSPSAKSPQCQATMQEIVFCENAIIHTLAFNFNIIQPNYLVLSYCNKLNLPKELTKLAYTLGTYILILSNMCVRYKPSILACVCVNLAYKCMKEPQPDAEEGQINEDYADISMAALENPHWAEQFENMLNTDLLDFLTNEYQNSVQRTPNDLKKELIRLTFTDSSQINPLISNLLFSKSQHSQLSLIDNSPVEAKPLVSEGSAAKRALFEDQQPPTDKGVSKQAKMDYPQYKEFSKKIQEFIEIKKLSLKLPGNCSDVISHDKSINPMTL